MPAHPAHQAVAAARKREITRIHVLRGALRMPKDEYHDLLGNLFDGRRSSTELDGAQRRRLIQHLEVLQRQAGGTAQPRASRPPLSPRQRKMFSLWQQLADAGLARERGMPALKTWVARQTGVDRWEWLNSHQEDTVIESLKRWLARKAEPARG